MEIDSILVGMIASSMTFALTTVICYIIGFSSGRVCTKCAKLPRGESVISNVTSYNIATNPIYDDMEPQEKRPRGKGLELNENVAYVIWGHKPE